MPVKVTLKYGQDWITADVKGGRLWGEIKPLSLPQIADIRQELINCLRCPIGTASLASLAQQANRAAVVISDHTRPLPSGLLLPPVLSELAQAGLIGDKVTVVIGVGNHRPVTEEEKQRLLGPVYGQVHCFHSKETGYQLLGTTKRGTPVEVALPVAEADLVVALGNIELHQLAGYSGGVKAVAAGTASHRALEYNHKLSALKQGGLGDLEDNAVRRDMEEFAGIANLKFIVNVVLDQHHQVVHLVAGDPVRAHRSGCMVADRIYRVKIDRPADIVLVSPGGAPKDDTVYQAQKSVQNALRAVKDEGLIIVTAKCPEGFGDPVFEEWMTTAAGPGELVARSGREFVLGGHKGVFVAQAVSKSRIFWVSDMKPEQVRHLFFQPFNSLQEAVDSALAVKGEEASVLVMPWGGLTVPEIVES